MTKQITVRGLDDRLHQALRALADARGVSVNRVVLDTLYAATGLEPRQPVEYHELDGLAGTWDAAQTAEFTTSLTEQRQIESELWS